VNPHLRKLLGLRDTPDPEAVGTLLLFLVLLAVAFVCVRLRRHYRTRVPARAPAPAQAPSVPGRGDPWRLTFDDCPRCLGRHVALSFQPLRRARADAVSWAYCPETGEPILASLVREPPPRNAAWASGGTPETVGAP
jgi:hypothetical protein